MSHPCSAGQWVSNYQCTPCTERSYNGYYLQPVTFDGKNNMCPWDCNAGYYRSGTDEFGSCVACTLGTSYSNTLRAKQDEDLNHCDACKKCKDEVLPSYQTQACTTTSNTVCTACLSPCTGRFYESQPCTPSQNRVCTQCDSCGSNNYIFSDCSNSATTDTKVCKPCLTGANCWDQRTFMPNSSLCTGTEHLPNFCQLCDNSFSCSTSQYKQKCSGSSDSQCKEYTICSEGYYLANRDLYVDGVCTPCTTCTSVSQACARFTVTLCEGETCDSVTGCRSNPHHSPFL
jgi:hypothetical protein